MCSPVPNVYSMAAVQLDERVQLYATEILTGVRCSQVEAALVDYVKETIEPVGWKAVWRSTPKSTNLQTSVDILVEVIDVSQSQLEARVNLLQILPKTDQSTSDVSAEDEANKLLELKTCTCPLLELFSIHDEATDSEFERTAEILEHLRFFYEALWLPWDADDDEDCVFVDVYLERRLRLFYDIASGVAPSSVGDRVKSIYRESRENHQTLLDIEKDVAAVGLDGELSEQDILRVMELRMKQEDLKRELQMMENPALRALMIKRKLAIKPTPRGRRPSDEVVIHIVAPKLLVSMIEDLPPSTIIEHHTSFNLAVSAAFEDDVIWVFPGMYWCEGLGWLEDSVKIEGKCDRPEEVVIESKGNSDIFFNCNANTVTMCNLTIRSSLRQHCLLMIHTGVVTLTDCHIEGAFIGVCINTVAEVRLKRCRIRKSEICGVNIHTDATVSMDQCQVSECNNFGVAIEFEDEEKKEPLIHVTNTQFSTNGRCGIVFYTVNQDIKHLHRAQLEDLADADDRFAEKVVLGNNSFGSSDKQVCQTGYIMPI